MTRQLSNEISSKCHLNHSSTTTDESVQNVGRIACSDKMVEFLLVEQSNNCECNCSSHTDRQILLETDRLHTHTHRQYSMQRGVLSNWMLNFRFRRDGQSKPRVHPEAGWENTQYHANSCCNDLPTKVISTVKRTRKIKECWQAWATEGKLHRPNWLSFS